MCYPLSEEQQYVSLFCVFDGYGGKRCSQYLGEIFPVVFEQVFLEFCGKNKSDLKELFVRAFQVTERKIVEQFINEGSTATMAVVWRPTKQERYLQVSNVGDSSAYLLNAGICTPITVEHKLGNPSESERIRLLDEKSTNSKSFEDVPPVTRAFGDLQHKSLSRLGLICEPHVSLPILITSDVKTLIMATNGLWNVISPQEAFEMIKDCKSGPTSSDQRCFLTTSS
eukprot:TRINITY_DN4282_c0_g2_i11.p1 TRINITY_DN4282_c0_g2~~TRINITY_DN4282_c0_g2_i11.p1  ORF type:complete len:226 (-),score=38.08 TRINITY_DN4282_c0_g2_i11:107-784(-)